MGITDIIAFAAWTLFAVILMAPFFWEPLKKVLGQTKTGLTRAKEWVGKMTLETRNRLSSKTSTAGKNSKEWRKQIVKMIRVARVRTRRRFRQLGTGIKNRSLAAARWTWKKIRALLRKARTRFEPSTPEAKEKWNDALVTAKRLVIIIFVLALLAVAVYPLSWFEIPKEGAFSTFFKWAFLGLWFVFLLVILATSILCWYAGWKKLAPILFAVFSAAVLSTLAMFMFTQLGDRYLPDRKFWKGHTEIVWWILALGVIVIAAFSWKWIASKSLYVGRGFGKFEMGGALGAVFTVLLMFVLANALFWYNIPELWSGAQSLGFWFFAIQILGLLLAWSVISRQKSWRILTALILSTIFLSIATLVAYVKPGELPGKMSDLALGIEGQMSGKAENVSSKEEVGVLSWHMPEGMVNLLYSYEDGNRYSHNRVTILRNDSQVVEMVSYSRYGGKLAEYRWDRRDQYGRWWTEGKNANRQSDSGDWYLEPDGPGQYRGAWRSQAQTGNRWIPMWVKIE